jgi:hypothetical protein
MIVTCIGVKTPLLQFAKPYLESTNERAEISCMLWSKNQSQSCSDSEGWEHPSAKIDNVIS